jgi:membrane protein DedA with SNARE-associated domain
LGNWSYVLLALLVATEGPLSTLLGAAAATAGILDIRLVFAATVVGNITGDTLWYMLGYVGKLDVVLRLTRWMGVERRHLARLEREMHAHAAKLIVFAKLAYGLIVPTLLSAGMARVPWRRWFPVVFVVETLWSLLLVWVGFHATGLIAQFEQGLRIVGAGVLAGAVVVVFRLLRQRIEREEIEMDPLLHAEPDQTLLIAEERDDWSMPVAVKRTAGNGPAPRQDVETGRQAPRPVHTKVSSRL